MKTYNIALSLSLIAALTNVFGDDIEDVDLGESVVTATGYQQLLKEAPASISIITKDELLNRPIRDLGDALQEVPGISTSISKTGSNSIMMRGLDSKYTLILIDGKRQNVAKGFGGNGFDPTSGFIPPTSMIERIEVIRGPASVIYGSDALGGVINIITKKTPNKLTGSFQLETRLQENNRNWGHMYGFNGYIATPLIDDVLSMNLRGRFNTTGPNKFYKSDIPGYTGNATTNPYTSHSPTGYTIASVGGRLNYTINDENNIYIDSEFNYQNLGSLNTSSSQITAIRDYYKYNTVINHDASYEFGDFNTYLQFADTQQISRKDVPIGASGWKGTPNRSTMQDNKILILNSSWNKHYFFDTAGMLISNAGLYYMYEQFEARPSSNNHQNQVALFGEAEYIPIDLISTTLGLRLNYSDLYKAMPNPRFYVNIHPTNNFTIKAGIASGMSIPQLSYLYDGYIIKSSNEYYYGNKNLQAEKSWNYELSFIFDVNPVLITLTGFYTDFRDKIDTITYNSSSQIPGIGNCNGSNCYVYKNVDKALSTGAEFALQMKRIYGIGFDLSYAYTFTKQLSGDNKGSPLNTVPRHNTSAKLSYQIAGFDTYLRYVGKYKTPTGLAHTANTGVGDWYKDVHLFDLGFNYKFDNTWNLGFVINNLFNTNFVDYVTTNNGSSYTNLYQRMIPSRNYWINLRAEF